MSFKKGVEKRREVDHLRELRRKDRKSKASGASERYAGSTLSENMGPGICFQEQQNRFTNYLSKKSLRIRAEMEEARKKEEPKQVAEGSGA